MEGGGERIEPYSGGVGGGGGRGGGVNFCNRHSQRQSRTSKRNALLVVNYFGLFWELGVRNLLLKIEGCLQTNAAHLTNPRCVKVGDKEDL